jgi:hypothetical protein
VDRVDDHPRVVGHGRQARVVLEPGQEQAVLGDEHEVLLALDVAQVLDARVEVGQVLAGLDRVRDVVVE